MVTPSTSATDFSKSRRRRQRRGDLVSSALFAGGSLAAFAILLACVFAATVLYYRWH